MNFTHSNLFFQIKNYLAQFVLILEAASLLWSCLLCTCCPLQLQGTSQRWGRTAHVPFGVWEHHAVCNTVTVFLSFAITYNKSYNWHCLWIIDQKSVPWGHHQSWLSLPTPSMAPPCCPQPMTPFQPSSPPPFSQRAAISHCSLRAGVFGDCLQRAWRLDTSEISNLREQSGNVSCCNLHNLTKAVWKQSDTHVVFQITTDYVSVET